MTTEEIPDLEPLEEPVPQAPQVDYKAAIFQRMLTGAAAPFYNPGASKEYFRFLFAGVLIVVGCFMPFDHDWSHVGYKHVSGGVWLIIGLGLIWSMWGAINTGRPVMKWVLLAFFPFIWATLHMVFASFPKEEALVNNWLEVFTIIGNTSDDDRFHKIGDALQRVGPGKIFIFLGSLIAVFGFFGGIFGGVKRIQEQKAQRSAAVAARRSK